MFEQINDYTELFIVNERVFSFFS